MVSHAVGVESSEPLAKAPSDFNDRISDRAPLGLALLRSKPLDRRIEMFFL
jgi:hypothetical protein